MPSILNLSPQNPRQKCPWLASTMLVSPQSVSAPPPATMIQKWVGAFLAAHRGTASLLGAGHCHAHLHDKRVSWPFQPARCVQAV